MAITRLALSLAATCLMFTSTFAQQNSATADAQTFAAVVKQNFRQWDRNGDGVLSKAEIDAAVADGDEGGSEDDALDARLARGTQDAEGSVAGRDDQLVLVFGVVRGKG